MKAPEFRIAPNDPTLAHAAAYGQIKRLRVETEKLHERLQELEGKTQVTRGAAMIRKHFGKLILMESITRLKGSRPKARWLALDANVEGGGDMVLVIVEADKWGWALRDLMLRLSPHAVARLMQRTTGSSNLERFAQTLRHHILTVLPIMSRTPEDHSVTTASGSGAMIWVPHGEGFRGVTWLSVDSMTDEKMAEMCRNAGATRIAVLISRMTGEQPWSKPAVTAAGTSPTMRP